MADNKKETVARSSGYLLIDTNKCQGCLTCMLACSLAHTGEENLAASRIQVTQNSFATYPDDVSLNAVQTCDLCADAPHWNRPSQSPERLACVTLCPVGAIRFSEVEPAPGPDGSHDFNFRGEGWRKLGYPTD